MARNSPTCRDDRDDGSDGSERAVVRSVFALPTRLGTRHLLLRRWALRTSLVISRCHDEADADGAETGEHYQLVHVEDIPRDDQDDADGHEPET